MSKTYQFIKLVKRNTAYESIKLYTLISLRVLYINLFNHAPTICCCILINQYLLYK